MEALIESIKRHEGFRDRVYLDSEGKPTCGWGHYLYVGSKVPLVACEEFFKQDVANAISAYQAIPPAWRKKLNISRARVITEMLFNMNSQKLLQFRKMWTAIEAADYEQAASEMLDSRWAEQVGERAIELAKIMRQGE
jgi:lysozyme